MTTRSTRASLANSTSRSTASRCSDSSDSPWKIRPRCQSEVWSRRTAAGYRAPVTSPVGPGSGYSVPDSSGRSQPAARRVRGRSPQLSAGMFSNSRWRLRFRRGRSWNCGSRRRSGGQCLRRSRWIDSCGQVRGVNSPCNRGGTLRWTSRGHGRQREADHVARLFRLGVLRRLLLRS